MKQITEFLLDKAHAHVKSADEAEYNKFIMKLYHRLGYRHSGFKNLLKDGTFTYYTYDDNEIKKYVPQQIIDLATIENDKKGSGKFYKWNVIDILDHYDYDYEKAYNKILEWYGIH